MLMVDRVELIAFHQPEQVRELQRENAVGLEQSPEPTDEVVQVRDLGEYVVADKEIRGPPGRGEALRHAFTEEVNHRGDATVQGDLRHVAGGLHAEHWNPPGQKVLQQVAIVAADLDDPTRLTEREPG